MTARNPLVCLFAVLFVVSGAACGSDSGSGSDSGVSGQSAAQLLRNARSKLTHSRVVTIKGAGTEGGSKLKLDMTYAAKTAQGTITLDGAKIRLLKSHGHSYFKGTDAFYDRAAGANSAQFKALVHGRWILVDPKNKEFAAFASFLDRTKFLVGLANKLKGNLSKGTERRVAGVECIPLRDASGTMWLNASNGSIVRLVTKQGQALSFSYAHVRPAKPPKPSDVFDLASVS